MTETTATIHRSNRITKPGRIRIAARCSRCGGAGGAAAWAHTGYTCFRCGGNGQEPNGQQVFAYPADWTDEQVAEHEAKRDAARAKRADAKAAKAKVEADAARAEFAAANPEAIKVLKRYAKDDEFVADLARQYEQRGSLSERQIEVLLAKPARIKEQAAKAKAEAERVAQATPVPNGTEIVTGEILSTKVVDSDYGSTLKMLVLDDRGFKVWGSVPRSLPYGELKGERVTFTAAVERSHDDPLFGFFKRPRKAEVVD